MDAAPDDALIPVDVARHDRGAGGHRLEEDDAERLAAGRRRDEDIGGPEELGLLLVAHPAEELDALHPTRQDVAARLAFLRAGADDEQPASASGLAQDAVRREEVEEPLARLVAADEEDVVDAVLPPREGDGALVAHHVDAIRDDLVVAGEVAVDEMARGRAHRDPAVEAVRVAAHRAAAELVGRRPAAVRVEGRDVDARGGAQHDRREERHERLVEVQQVERLGLEHVGDLGEVPWRQRDRADGAVRGHTEALADSDDVALGGALQPVARREDPDVMAARPETLVKVPDVLVDSARQGIHVRRDEPDLHPRGPRAVPTGAVSAPVIDSSASRASVPSSKRGGRSRPPG